MSSVIKILGLADGRPTNADGTYLKEFDPDGADGFGRIEFAQDIEDAQVFESNVEAMQEWRRQSTTRPLRPDGKPNRPLTMFTVEVVRR